MNSRRPNESPWREKESFDSPAIEFNGTLPNSFESMTNRVVTDETRMPTFFLREVFLVVRFRRSAEKNVGRARSFRFLFEGCVRVHLAFLSFSATDLRDVANTTHRFL